MNDFKRKTDEIHKALTEAHSKAGLPTVTQQKDIATLTLPQTAFAQVERIHPDSPAFMDGMRAGDVIVKFGDATGFDEVKDVVSRNANKGISVTVKRELENSLKLEVLKLLLTPREWADGPGLLGCLIVPL